MTFERRLLTGAALAVFMAAGGTAVTPVLTPASMWTASAQVSQEIFEAELAPFGQWFDNPRYGRVWSPSNMPADWRPYSTGRWEWTDDDGWYWQADEPWGWIPFHYGRWFYDNRDGWLWVPGLVWGPAWVTWREGDNGYLGWAPLPPEDMDEVAGGQPPMMVPGPTATAPPPPQPYAPEPAYYSNPNYWTFVRPTDFAAPNIYSVRIAPPDYGAFFPRSRVVYRTDLRIGGQYPRGFNRGFDRVYIERVGRRPVVVARPQFRYIDAEIERRRGADALRLYRENRQREAQRVQERQDRRQERQREERRDERQQEQRREERQQEQRREERQQERQQEQRREERQQEQRRDERQQQQQREQRQQERQQEQRRDERQQQQQREQRQQERQQEQRREERQQQQQQQQRQEERQQRQQEQQRQERQQQRQQEQQRQERQQQQQREQRQQERQQQQQQQRQENRQQQQEQRRQERRENRNCPQGQTSC